MVCCYNTQPSIFSLFKHIVVHSVAYITLFLCMVHRSSGNRESIGFSTSIDNSPTLRERTSLSTLVQHNHLPTESIVTSSLLNDSSSILSNPADSEHKYSSFINNNSSSNSSLVVNASNKLAPTTQYSNLVLDSNQKHHKAHSLAPTMLQTTAKSPSFIRNTMQQFFSPKQVQLMAKLSWYYFLVYFFTVVYNVANKKVLESFPVPWTVAASQVALGVPLFLPLWIWKRPFPNFFSFFFSRSPAATRSEQLSFSYVSKIAVCHGFGNVATVMALTSGSVSFVHVIKAAEPLFSAFLSVYFLQSKLSVWTYASLLPIVIGVALASMKEVSFSWFVFGSAMLSNLLYMSRMVLSKVSLQQQPVPSTTTGSHSTNPPTMKAVKVSTKNAGGISAVNMFRLVTLIAALQLIPCALFFEQQKALSLWRYLQEQRPNEFYFVWTNLLLSGVSFYIYNEVAFWILDLVHPVTAAVGNSIKRIVLILASIIVFQTQVSELGWIGSAMAIGGSLAYALSQSSSQSSSTPNNTVISTSNSFNNLEDGGGNSSSDTLMRVEDGNSATTADQ